MAVSVPTRGPVTTSGRDAPRCGRIRRSRSSGESFPAVVVDEAAGVARVGMARSLTALGQGHKTGQECGPPSEKAPAWPGPLPRTDAAYIGSGLITEKTAPWGSWSTENRPTPGML